MWTGSTRVRLPNYQSLTQKRCRAIFYDESIYPIPYTYDPERYLKDGRLDPSVKDPGELVFGSSRRCEFRTVVPSSLVVQLTHCTGTLPIAPSDRVCPGKHFAMRALFINITCILSLLNIEAPIDEKLEAGFSEKGALRCVTLPGHCFAIPLARSLQRLCRL